MNFDEIMDEQRKRKKSVDYYELNYLYDEDVDVCNYVAEHFPYIDISLINSGRSISFDVLLQKSLEEMKIFGDDIYSAIVKLTSKTDIVRSFEEVDCFATLVSYNKVDDIIFNDSGNIRYMIPKKINELSIYHLGHEHVHALKETNYDEYRDNITLGETIPIFYELLIFNPGEILKKELIKFRMKYLMINREEYLIFNDLFIENRFYELIDDGDNIKEQTRLYEFVRSKVGCYLNSFYYALMLYSMYKETPDKILCLVSKVLRHEMTTIEMLECLNLYGDIRGEVFEKELGKIKKLVI